MAVFSSTTTWFALTAAIISSIAYLSGPESAIGAFFRPSNATYSQVETSAGFVEVAPRIYRFNYRWPQIPGVVNVPLATFLIDGLDQDWALVDAGLPSAVYTSLLLKNIKDFLEQQEGSLQLLILTHHHPDHVGGIKAILREYPDIRIAAHVEEKPFLVEGKPGGILPSTEFWFKTACRLGFLNNKVPTWAKEKVCYMFGKAGDLADLTCDSDADNLWHPNPGDIKWRQAPGHSPGGLILQIGRDIIAGDVVAAMRYPWMSKDAIFEPYFLANYNTTEVRSSISMLASLDFDKLFPSHDIGKGITQSDIQAWAVDLMA